MEGRCGVLPHEGSSPCRLKPPRNSGRWPEAVAIWVREEKVHPRAGMFLAQHIAVVLPAAALVHNLHEAYERISLGAAGFSLFLSGPSKTADIEQSLVIGAHGARSCTVILL